MKIETFEVILFIWGGIILFVILVFEVDHPKLNKWLGLDRIRTKVAKETEYNLTSIEGRRAVNFSICRFVLMIMVILPISVMCMMCIFERFDK